MFLLWVEPEDEYVIEEPVEYAYEDQAFDNSENLAGKMTTPRNHFYLCFPSCSFYHYVALPTTCLLCLPYCHVKPLTHHVLANHCLAMLSLCSAPLIALLVAGEVWRSFLVGLPSYCLVHHFPSGARICIAYHILHIIHVLHHVACAFLVVDCGSVCLCSCLG